MKHILLIAALAALAACASPQPQPTDTGAGLAMGHDIDCNAGDVVDGRGERSTLYISLNVPDGGGEGSFCIATGCEAANFEPAASATGGFAAIMRTGDRTEYNARVEISRDLRTFTLSEGNSDESNTWTGTCNAAGS